MSISIDVCCDVGCDVGCGCDDGGESVGGSSSGAVFLRFRSRAGISNSWDFDEVVDGFVLRRRTACVGTDFGLGAIVDLDNVMGRKGEGVIEGSG